MSRKQEQQIHSERRRSFLEVADVLGGHAGHAWNLDFVSDTLISGRCIRILAVAEDFTCECLALVVDTSLSGARVASEFDAIIAAGGRPPLMIVSDNPVLSLSKGASN